MAKNTISILMAFIGFTLYAEMALLAQTTAKSTSELPSMEVRRVGLADLNSILRAADANSKVRELLDVHRQKFQDEFRKIEIDKGGS